MWLQKFIFKDTFSLFVWEWLIANKKLSLLLDLKTNCIKLNIIIFDAYSTWDCVHSMYARFWPFLTHPSPLYAFHTLRLDPSLSYIRNRLTHPPYKLCKCAFSKTLLNTFSYKEPFPLASWEEWVFLTFWTKLKSPTSLYYPPTLITPKKSWCPIETAKIQKAKKLRSLCFVHTQWLDPSTHPIR